MALDGKDENANDKEFGTQIRIEDVLPKILKYLPFDFLLSARQVSRTWNSAVCSHPPSAKRCVVTVRQSVDSALSLFCSAIGSTLDTDTPSTFCSFRFITKFVNNSTPPQVEFWTTLGRTIKYLDLSHHSLGAVSFLEVLLACPHLKELSFDCAPICLNHASTLLGPDGEVYLCRHADGQNYQKLIPNSQFIEKSGLLHGLEALHITNSNFLPPGVLSDLLQWGGGSLRTLSIMDEAPGIQSMLALRRSFNKPVIPAWDIRHVLYLVEHQAKILQELELCGQHIEPEHIYALAKTKHLNLRVLKLRTVQADTPSLISLFRRQKYLEELDLSYANGVSEKAFLHPSCTFFKLRKLTLTGYTSHLDFLSFLSRMVNLVELNLSQPRSHSMTWDNLIHSFLPIKLRRLTRLDLSYCIALGGLNRHSLFQSFIRSLRSTLTCLNLSCNACMKNNYLQVLWHELPKLRILYLEQVPGVSDEGFTGIRQIQLFGNEDGKIGAGGKRLLNDYLNSSVLLRKHNNGAGHIGYCSDIETLSLAGNQKLTDFVVQYGVRFIANLRKVKLSGCPKLSDRTIFFLIGSCPKMEYLDLRGCRRITETWIKWAENVSASTKLKILLDSGHHSQAECPVHSRSSPKTKAKTKSTETPKVAEGQKKTGNPYTLYVEDDESDNYSASAPQNRETDEDGNSSSTEVEPSAVSTAVLPRIRRYRLATTTPSTSGNGNRIDDEDFVYDHEEGPFKINITDANNNNLKIPK